MDRRPDSNAGSLTAVAVSSAKAPPGAVACEQAVFTAIRSATGQGYRVIAASAGLDPTESSEIIQRTPAVGGLCVDSPDAVGVSFFGLSTGRYAILLTCHAGKEPTGRGGRRTYTRILVIDADGLRRFNNNPFAVLRSIEEGDGLTVDLTPPRVLPPLQVVATPSSDPHYLAEAAMQAGATRLAALVDGLLAGRSFVVATEGDLLTLTESLLLALPAPMRPQISLSFGVPFTASRPHRLVVISGASPVVRQRMTGTPYAFVDVADRADPPAAEHPWAIAVGRLIGTVEGASQLLAVADRCTAAEAGAMDRLAALCLARGLAETSAMEKLPDLAAPYVDAGGASVLEHELIAQVVQTVTRRMAAELPTADTASAAAVCQAFHRSAARSEKFAQFAITPTSQALERIAATAPAQAARTLMEIVTLPWAARAVAAFEPARVVVWDRLSTWVATAPPDALTDLRAEVDAWRRRTPGDERLSAISAQITTRLSEASAPPAAEPAAPPPPTDE